MDFAVLGPLEVRGESGPIELRGRRARRLLIALLLRTGRVVPSDVLIDQVWGDNAPADAANALQVQVSQLRRVLGLRRTGAAPALRTVPTGYVLDVAPASVDVARFERLVAEAGERLSSALPGDAEEALAELEVALDLWRGEPLQDVAYEPFAEADAARLHELRATALEQLVECHLVLGRNDEVVPMLRQMIAERPERERLRAQLMTALYRAGRQADALRAFNDARSYFVDELGVEPGPELRRLQQMVLDHDPELDWAPASPVVRRVIDASGDGHVPNNLPWSPTPLIGREDELDALPRFLGEGGARLMTLVGPPGVGKTRLAVDIGGRLLRRFPDGVWFVDLSGVGDPDLVPTTIAAAARVPIDGVASVTAALASHWRSSRVLVVLDNCEHVRAHSAALAGELLARCGGVSILATSRQSLQVRGEQEVPVGPLAEEPAVALLVARAGEVNPRFSLGPENATAVAELCRRLDGLPLALELAARWLRLLTVEELLARVDSPLDMLRDGPVDLPARQQTLRGALRWSYDLLDPAEQAMFRRLAVFAGGATLDAATAVTGAAGPLDDDPVVLANRLVAASLLQRHDDDGHRLRMLAVIREFASELLAASADAEPTRRAHAAHFALIAKQSDEALKGADQQTWLTGLGHDIDNLRAALAWCSVHDVDQGLGMAAALWRFWDMRGEREEARTWLEALLASEDATTATPARAWALRCLGNLDSTLRRFDEATAHYEESLRLARHLGEQSHTLRAISNLGNLATDTGEWSRARALLEEAVAISRSSGDDWMVALTLGNLADLSLRLGDAETATALFEEAMATFSRLGDDQHALWCQLVLSEALHHSGDGARSRVLFADGLARVVAVGDSRTRAYALSKGGLFALDRGDHRQAAVFLATALKTRQEYLGDEYVAADLTVLAECAVRTGDRRRAVRLLGAASAIMEETGEALPALIEQRFERAHGDLRGALEGATFAAAWRGGRRATGTVLAEAAASATDDLQTLIDDAAAQAPLSRAG